MRIRVKDVLDLLAARVPREEILEDSPYLENEVIDAAVQYAATQLDSPVLRAEIAAEHLVDLGLRRG